MPLQIATTTGTLAPPIPTPANADGSVAEFRTAPAQGALRDLDTGLNLAQELNDWIAVLTVEMPLPPPPAPPVDPWSMKLAVFKRLAAQIAATAELTATRVVPAP